MQILILNGSPRKNGKTNQLIQSFSQGALQAGHKITVIDVCHKTIHGCLACEYCHKTNIGKCVQDDEMQEVYDGLAKAEVLVLASPIYYHNLSGQLKCVIDRFYAVATRPQRPPLLKKAVMLLASGDPDMYTGAQFSFQGDFLDYLKLENGGIVTMHEKEEAEKLQEAFQLGASL